MRPYLAVVKDSFREAMSSRVLPVLLVVFTINLLLLAPIGVKEELAAELKLTDIYDGPGLIGTLTRQAERENPSPGKHIWSLLSNELTSQIKQFNDPREAARRGMPIILRAELNELFHRPDFFDREAWKHVDLGDETEVLLKRGVANLDEAHLARFNRLAFNDAFPTSVAAAPRDAAELTYLGGKFYVVGDLVKQIFTERDDVQRAIEYMLSQFCVWVVGKFGILVAIIVSAGIIPRMFDEGTIDLLLSKPISRSGLFVTKFFSGCAFICLGAAYFMVGVWLIAGLRLGVWSGSVLLTIPVFMFQFAVVYTFSALAGVIWRNAIVCVMVTILVWGLCMLLGQFVFWTDNLQNPTRIGTITPAGETLVVTTRNGETFAWSETDDWTQIFAGNRRDGGPSFGFGLPMLGPIYDAEHNRIVAVEMRPTGIGVPAAAGNLLFAKQEDRWQRKVSLQTPPSTSRLFLDDDGAIITAGNGGVFELRGGDEAEGHVPFVIFGLDVGSSDHKAKFVKISPDADDWPNPFAAAVNAADGSTAVYTAGRILLLSRNDQRRLELAATLLDGDSEEPAELAFSGNRLMIAFKSGRILLFDTESNKQLQELAPHDAIPRNVQASADGRWFAVVYHDKHVWLYDAVEQQEAELSIRNQGDVTASAFSNDGSFLTAHDVDAVTSYDPGEGVVKAQHRPSRGWYRLSYEYGIKPLYYLLPKPSDLDAVIEYLFVGKQEEELPGQEHDLRVERAETHDVWWPLWANSVYLFVVLGLACWYIARRDF